LTLWAAQAECLWDESLPVEVRELPADLADLDRVLCDPELARPDGRSWPTGDQRSRWRAMCG
jgi:hypothetical protein